MKTSYLLGLVGTAVLAGSCGDNSERCGAGTHAQGGQCVADGTVICGQGTVLDAPSGTCVPDPDACADGTVLVDGQCVPEDDTLTADVEESSEPNDNLEPNDGTAGGTALPGVGADGVVLHGCIDPYRDLDGDGNPDPDFDYWTVTTTAPALLQVTADGVHGLAAGFAVVPDSQRSLDGWQRFGVNLAGDTSQRGVYLPVAGTYGLVLTDSRTLFFPDGAAAGGPDACYFVTVSSTEIPTPTEVPGNTPIAAVVADQPLFYGFTPVEGSIVIASDTLDSPAAAGSLTEVRNGEFAKYAAGLTSQVIAGGMAGSDDELFVVDPVFNYALAPVAHTFQIYAPDVAPLPDDGSGETVTNGDSDDLLLYVDVDDNEIVHFAIESDAVVSLIFLDSNGGPITRRDGVDAFDAWVRFPRAGRYYIDVVENTGTPATFEIRSTVAHVTPTPIGVPGSVDDAPFSDLGATWHTFTAGDAIWIALSASAVGFGDAIGVDLYPADAVGTPGYDFPSLDGATLASDGSTTVGRIVDGDDATYLVRVTAEDELADSTSRYDLAASHRDFANLGLVTPEAPLVSDHALGSDGTALLFVRGNPGDSETITVTPDGFDVIVEILDAAEVATGIVDLYGTDVAEVYETFVASPDWTAVRISRYSGTGTDFEVRVEATSPTPYVVTDGALTFQDICDDADAETLTPDAVSLYPADDEGVVPAQTMPFAFDLFGAAVSDYYISTNGFLAFDEPVPGDAFFANAPIPTPGAPDGLVAPEWRDLQAIVICRLEESDRVTIQWTGETYGSQIPAQTQTVLHASGVIDFLYGPGQTFDGAEYTTVGVETPGGSFGNQLSYNQAGTTVAGTSKVLTPAL